MSVCVLGSINMDIVLSVSRLPRPGETVSGATLAHFPGGKGSNQAIAAARLGADVAILGAVGDDEYGTVLADALDAAGVDTTALSRLDGETSGQAFVCVSAKGENFIVVVPGASRALGPDSVSGAGLAGHGVFLAQLEVPVETVQAFFSAPPARQGTRILNAAPAATAALPLLALADILVVNETELALFAGAGEPPSDATVIERLSRRLITTGGQTVIVTLGARGALAVTAGETVAVSGHAVPVVDTTGAGDCFCGALAAMLDSGAVLPAALEFANAAAAIAVTRKGAAPSMPGFVEVEALLAG